MRTTDSRTGIVLIHREEALRLLAADSVGRLGVVGSGGTAAIFPVNYVLDGESIVFRTAPGTKLDAGPRSPACFEIDQFDRVRRNGWSVVATGRLEEVERHRATELSRLQALPVDPWAGGERSHWMRLIPSRITGRRVGPS